MAIGITSYIGAPAPGGISTTVEVPLGTIVQALDLATDPKSAVELVYLKGVASTVVGSVVTYNPRTGVTALATAASRGPVAVALAATVANTYGWYQITGVVSAKAADTVVAGSPVFATGTPGTVDDANVSGDKIDGALLVSTTTTGLALVSLNRPSMNGNDVEGS